MLMLRKIDCYGQLLFAGVMILSCVLSDGGGFPVGLVVSGTWQLLSAIFNTYGFTRSGFSHRILLYWSFWVIDLVLFFSSYWLEIFPGHGSGLLFWTSLTGAFAVAGYYWWIYYKLIDFIFLRNELDGLTKSKH